VHNSFRIGIVGAGRIGGEAHLPAALACPGTGVAALRASKRPIRRSTSSYFTGRHSRSIPARRDRTHDPPPVHADGDSGLGEHLTLPRGDPVRMDLPGGTFRKLPGQLRQCLVLSPRRVACGDPQRRSPRRPHSTRRRFHLKPAPSFWGHAHLKNQCGLRPSAS